MPNKNDKLFERKEAKSHPDPSELSQEELKDLFTRKQAQPSEKSSDLFTKPTGNPDEKQGA